MATIEQRYEHAVAYVHRAVDVVQDGSASYDPLSRAIDWYAGTTKTGPVGKDTHMEKVETKQVPHEVPTTPADIWRLIAQQSLQSAMLLGVVGIGIKALMTLAEANKKKAMVPAPRPVAIDVDFEETEETEEAEEADSDFVQVVQDSILRRNAEQDAARKARQTRFDALFDRPAFEARTLLGVTVFDDADSIRRALRTKLAESRVHPDHGGDGDEAAKLVAAKNLLIERLARK